MEDVPQPDPLFDGVFENVKCGKRRIAVEEMADSSTLLTDTKKLKEAFEGEGYLLLRGFLEREQVLAARRLLLTANQDKLDLEDHSLMSAKMKEGTMISLMPQQYLCDDPQTKQLVSDLLEVEVEPVRYKWVRAIPKGDNTGIHIDRVHLDGPGRVITVWIPLGDIPVSQGTLAVLTKSQIPGVVPKHVIWKYKFKRTNPLDPLGWVSNDPLTVFGRPLPSKARNSSSESSEEDGKTKKTTPSTVPTTTETEMKWVTTNFKAGDIVIIGLDVIHMSTTNTTDFYRVSCDTRWIASGDPLPPACTFTNRISY